METATPTIAPARPEDPAVKDSRCQMLEDIAREFVNEVVFPTYFDADLRLSKVLEDPDAPLDRIASTVSLEPLISAKLLRLANSVAFNARGNEVKDIRSAVQRLGLNTVRSTSLAIVMTQIVRGRSMGDFSDIAQALWHHSVRAAAACRVLARQAGGLNPDVAMLAGLVHDLGAFYMLYKATQYEDLRSQPDMLKHLISQWHEGIGAALLRALGLPLEIIEANAEHDHARPLPERFTSYADVVYVANLLACDANNPWQPGDNEEQLLAAAEAAERHAGLLGEIEALNAEMTASFG